MRILYVEDEKILADAVIFLLNKNNIKVDWTPDGEEGFAMAKKPIYDAIVLDIMLPKMSGLDILTSIRKLNIKTPIIMLSALSQVEDKIQGLEQGADDYLAKPFKTSELIARLNALVRRPPLVSEKIIKYADLVYNDDAHTLNGVLLTTKEAEILKLLIEHPEKIQAKANILARVWGATAFNEDNYVEVYVSYLRSKLKQIGSKTKIVTIRNLGYKLTNVQ